MALASGADAFMEISRVGEFMAHSEVNEAETAIEASPEKIQLMDKEDMAVKVDHADFEWEIFTPDEEEQENQKNYRAKR